MKISSTWTVCLLGLSAAGCASSLALRTEEGRGLTQMKRVEPAKILVSCAHDLEPGSKVLGAVVASADGLSSDKAIAKLREAASGLGANAVIDLRLEISQGFWAAAVKATGLAVRRGDR